MRILGISVDAENLPTKDVLIAMAMTTKRFKDNPLAEQEIKKELSKSGLFKDKPIQTEEDGLHRDSAKEDIKHKRK